MDKKHRPKALESRTYKIKTGCGNAYITVCRNGEPLEVFMKLGKSGGCANCQTEAITRCLSIGLRYGVPVEEYVHQLKDLKCPNQEYDGGTLIQSCPDAVAHALRESEGGDGKTE